ncbi:MAG: hypothetical protein QG656_1321 [Candidatus Hydrogenedentes bacterium]|nr:hypothetical protein [Candidatus Hydrogenedentota bacterium]
MRCKGSFNRMGGQMRYVTADNRDFLLVLVQGIREVSLRFAEAL